MDPDDIIVIRIGEVNNNVATITPAELAAINTNLVTLNGQRLEQHTGVDPAGMAAGKTFLVAPDGVSWLIGTPPGLTRVAQDGTSKITNAGSINVKSGLQATDDGAGEVGIAPRYGTTSSTIAEGNHQHTSANVTRTQFGATGTLSSGSRTLATLNVVLASGIDWMLYARGFVVGRNNISSGTFSVGIRLGGSASYPEEFQEYQTVGGVPTPCEVDTSRPLVGGGNITCTLRAIISSPYGSGDPVDLRAGRVVVQAWPRR